MDQIFSEHAKVRLFERGLKINVDAIVNEMFSDVVKEAVRVLGGTCVYPCECPFTKKKIKLVIRDGVVVTVKG